MLITIFTCIYFLTKYSTVPEKMPIHWNINGVVDGFVEKSFIGYLGIVGMIIALCFIMCLSAIYSLKSRAKLSNDNLEQSKLSNIHYIKKIGFSFFILNTSIQLLFITILISVIRCSNINPLWMIILVFILTTSSIYLTYVCYKTPSKQKNSVYTVDDEDDLWIAGMLYNNPNDPAILVNKRFGVGFTINIAHLTGKILFIFPFIILILSLLLL